MSVLRIDTGRLAEAALLADAAGRGIADAVSRVGGDLARSGGMAGWDAMGSEWAASYDPAALDAVAACHELALACSDTSRALSVAAGNYVEAEHVASMGLSALILPFLPAALPDGPSSSLPSASDGNPGWPPPGWDIISGIAGVLWPAGDPAALRSAGTAWTSLAVGLEAIMDGPTSSARDAVDGLTSEDLTLFRARSAGIEDTGRRIALASRDIADGCISLAGAIALAHDELIDETHSFLLECAALAGVGIALSSVTLGGSAAITSLVGAARAAQMVMRVQAVLVRLASVARSAGTVTARLPGAARLTSGLHRVVRTPAAVSSPASPARRALSAVAGQLASSPQLSRLAPAVRVVRPVGAAGLRVLDSRAVSVALSNPAALALDLLPLATRRTALRSVVAEGSTPDRIFALLRTKGLDAAPLLPAAEAAVRTKDRVDTVNGLATLPGSVRERYLPRKVVRRPLGDGGPGRLTAVPGSPATGPTIWSTRGHRTSHPAASP